jgi:hypothetical protein
MTEERAVALVLARREELEIEPEMRLDGAERAIVEYLADPDQPGTPEDRVAWIVSLGCEWGFVGVHVDDRSGEILTVERSR